MEFKEAKKHFEKSILAISKEFNLDVSKFDISYYLELDGQSSMKFFCNLKRQKDEIWLKGFNPRISHYFITNALRELQRRHPVFSQYNSEDRVFLAIDNMYPNKIKRFDNSVIKSIKDLDYAFNELRNIIMISKATLEATNTWEKFCATMKNFSDKELLFIFHYTVNITNPYIFILYKLFDIDYYEKKNEYFAHFKRKKEVEAEINEFINLLDNISRDELMNIPFHRLIPLNSDEIPAFDKVGPIYTPFNDEVGSLYIIEDPTLQNMDGLMNTLKRNFGDLGPFLGEEDIFSAVNDDKIFAIGHKDGVTFVTMPVNDSEDVLNMYEGIMWYDALIRSECKGQVLSWHQYKEENQILKYSNRSNTIVQQDKNDIDIMVWRDDNTFKDDFKFLFLNGDPHIFKKVGELPFENKDANMSYYCQKLLSYYLQKITGSSNFTDSFFHNIKLNVIDSTLLKI